MARRRRDLADETAALDERALRARWDDLTMLPRTVWATDPPLRDDHPMAIAAGSINREARTLLSTGQPVAARLDALEDFIDALGTSPGAFMSWRQMADQRISKGRTTSK